MYCGLKRLILFQSMNIQRVKCRGMRYRYRVWVCVKIITWTCIKISWHLDLTFGLWPLFVIWLLKKQWKGHIINNLHLHVLTSNALSLHFTIQQGACLRFSHHEDLTLGYMYMVIDQERGQDGWIFTKFFFFACLLTDMESGSINLQDKNEANIQPYWPNNLGP